MFKQIKIEKGPIHAGKTFSFNNGTTAIIGENGCGKSLLVEYLCFALFGSVALRGKVTDYKDLTTTLWFTLKGKDYKIERDTKNCKIYDSEGSIICVGTKACNLKIIALLGYDYNVFKMGNYAAQLDILGLGNMKPSERKTALDRTLGIGIIDKVIKRMNDKAIEYSHKVDTLNSLLKPLREEPIPPLGYRNLDDVLSEYREQEKKLTEYNTFTATVPPVEPENPESKYSQRIKDASVNEISETVNKRSSLESKLAEYNKAIKPSWTREYLEEQKELNKAYKKYENYLIQRGNFIDDEPTITLTDFQQMEKAWNLWDRYNLEMKYYKENLVTCPSCGKVFNSSKAEPIMPDVPIPYLDKNELRRQKVLLDNMEVLSKLEVVEEVKEPELNEKEIEERMFLSNLWEKQQLEKPVVEKELLSLPDFVYGDLAKRINYERELAVYTEQTKVYAERKVEYDKLFEKFKLFNPTKEINIKNNLAVIYNLGVQYEKEKECWDRERAAYEELRDKIDEALLSYDRYKDGVENLKEMKVKIKGYVLPSLQKVSSLLLSEMSDGLFNNIEISPDFDILVEGREINLFSGSEQAMINLALRLGLGQVLTHRVFSVFIGDEIDASMREDRAQLTADCLRKISKYINQVILVSHRNIEADHYIDLNGDKNV